MKKIDPIPAKVIQKYLNEMMSDEILLSLRGRQYKITMDFLEDISQHLPKSLWPLGYTDLKSLAVGNYHIVPKSKRGKK
jgi:hypothetical protein